MTERTSEERVEALMQFVEDNFSVVLGVRNAVQVSPDAVAIESGVGSAIW